MDLSERFANCWSGQRYLRIKVTWKPWRPDKQRPSSAALSPFNRPHSSCETERHFLPSSVRIKLIFDSIGTHSLHKLTQVGGCCIDRDRLSLLERMGSLLTPTRGTLLHPPPHPLNLILFLMSLLKLSSALSLNGKKPRFRASLLIVEIIPTLFYHAAFVHLEWGSWPSLCKLTWARLLPFSPCLISLHGQSTLFWPLTILNCSLEIFATKKGPLEMLSHKLPCLIGT